MKPLQCAVLPIVLVACITVTATAQEMHIPKPGPELDVLKADVGHWDVEIKSWQGPDELVEPVVTKGKETNRMLGGFWLLTDFQGAMMGLEFQGHGVYGYDAKKSQYFGTWVDSLGSNKMDMIGNHDPENKTMTYKGTAADPDGNPVNHVLETKYNDDGTHVMTMRVQAGDEMVKIFEMKYTRAPGHPATNKND